MKDNKNIFKPNYIVFFIGNVTILYFIALIGVVFYVQGSVIKLETTLLCLIALFFLIRALRIFLDVWTVKIQKKEICIKRPWQKHWTGLDTDTFTKIELKVKYRGIAAFVAGKQLTIYTENYKKYNFYTHSSKLEEELYMALLNQTPRLLAEYKSKKKQEYKKQEKYSRMDIVDWVVIVAMLLFLITVHLI